MSFRINLLNVKCMHLIHMHNQTKKDKENNVHQVCYIAITCWNKRFLVLIIVGGQGYAKWFFCAKHINIISIILSKDTYKKLGIIYYKQDCQSGEKTMLKC